MAAAAAAAAAMDAQWDFSWYFLYLSLYLPNPFCVSLHFCSVSIVSWSFSFYVSLSQYI
jgi:hypothetical protein